MIRRFVRFEGPDAQHINMGMIQYPGHPSGQIIWPETLPVDFPVKPKLINRGSGGPVSIPTYRWPIHPAELFR